MKDDFNTEAIHDFNSLLGEHIRNATRGATADARAILREFCACVKNNTDSKGNPFKRSSGVGHEVVTNTQIDERIIRYLAECFEEILKIEKTTQSKKGEKAMKVYDALHLKSNKRQADPGRQKREMSMANEVQSLRDAGDTLEMAFGKVAAKYYPDTNCNGEGATAVKAAHRKYNIKLQAKKISKQIQKQ